MTTISTETSPCQCATSPIQSIVRDAYLTPAQLVDYLDGAVTETTLRNWRCDRRGPTPTVIGRDVRYRVKVVDEWLAELEHH